MMKSVQCPLTPVVQADHSLECRSEFALDCQVLRGYVSVQGQPTKEFLQVSIPLSSPPPLLCRCATSYIVSSEADRKLESLEFGSFLLF